VAARKPATKYNPAMCKTMIDMGLEGASQKMIWSALGISKSTAENWRKKYPDFAEALDQALVHSQAYWERIMLANVDNKNFNTRMVEIAVRGQFAQDYRESKDTKIDIKNEVNTVDFNKSIQELLKKLRETE